MDRTFDGFMIMHNYEYKEDLFIQELFNHITKKHGLLCSSPYGIDKYVRDTKKEITDLRNEYLDEYYKK